MDFSPELEHGDLLGETDDKILPLERVVELLKTIDQDMVYGDVVYFCPDELQLLNYKLNKGPYQSTVPDPTKIEKAVGDLTYNPMISMTEKGVLQELRRALTQVKPSGVAAIFFKETNKPLFEKLYKIEAYKRDIIQPLQVYCNRGPSNTVPLEKTRCKAEGLVEKLELRLGIINAKSLHDAVGAYIMDKSLCYPFKIELKLSVSPDGVIRLGEPANRSDKGVSISLKTMGDGQMVAHPRKEKTEPMLTPTNFRILKRTISEFNNQEIPLKHTPA